MMLRRLLIGIWLLGTSVVIGVMMARHMAPFHHPLGLELAARSLAAKTGGAEELVAVHILDPRCSCSDTVMTYLTNTPPEAGVANTALLLSPPDAKLREALTAAGISVRETSPEAAKKEFGLETVPWFVVVNRNLDILYSGGYAAGPIRTQSDLEIAAIIKRLKDHSSNPSLPSYGCVTSQEIRQQLGQR